MLRKMADMESEREHLKDLSARLYEILCKYSPIKPAAVSHIQALIVGDAARAVEISLKLRENGIVALPIRTPTVPAGTERIRFSLSARNTFEELDKLDNALECILKS